MPCHFKMMECTVLEGATVMSKKSKDKMKATLAKVDPAQLAEAKTMEDSVNLAVSYNLKQNITESTEEGTDDILISIDKNCGNDFCIGQTSLQ